MNKEKNNQYNLKTEEYIDIDEIIELNEIYYIIAKQLVDYRKENNLTQTALAEKIKVNQTMISKLESGEYNPTIKLIHKISRKLTNSSEMLKDIFTEIVDNLNQVSNIEVMQKLSTENNKKYIEYNNSIPKNNMLFFKEYYKEGVSSNEKSKCELSNVRSLC